MKNTYGSIGAEHGVLAQTVPHDIVWASQRERILEAMAACCAEKTFRATTIGDIVGQAGVSRRTFYKLFVSKQECFEAAVNDFAGELSEIVATVRAGESPWSDEVCAGISELLELLASRPAFANLVLVESIAVDPALINRFWAPVFEALAGRMGGPPPGDPTQTAIGTAQVLIAQQIAAGRADRLPGLLPDLVYVALMPFVGHEKALEEARQAR